MAVFGRAAVECCVAPGISAQNLPKDTESIPKTHMISRTEVQKFFRRKCKEGLFVLKKAKRE